MQCVLIAHDLARGSKGPPLSLADPSKGARGVADPNRVQGISRSTKGKNPGSSGEMCGFSSLAQLMSAALRIGVDLEAAPASKEAKGLRPLRR